LRTIAQNSIFPFASTPGLMLVSQMPSTIRSPSFAFHAIGAVSNFPLAPPLATCARLSLPTPAPTPPGRVSLPLGTTISLGFFLCAVLVAPAFLWATLRPWVIGRKEFSPPGWLCPSHFFSTGFWAHDFSSALSIVGIKRV